jgi:hypothetical protein
MRPFSVDTRFPELELSQQPELRRAQVDVLERVLGFLERRHLEGRVMPWARSLKWLNHRWRRQRQMLGWLHYPLMTGLPPSMSWRLSGMKPAWCVSLLPMAHPVQVSGRSREVVLVPVELQLHRKSRVRDGGSESSITAPFRLHSREALR